MDKDLDGERKKLTADLRTRLAESGILQAAIAVREEAARVKKRVKGSVAARGGPSRRQQPREGPRRSSRLVTADRDAAVDLSAGLESPVGRTKAATGGRAAIRKAIESDEEFERVDLLASHLLEAVKREELGGEELAAYERKKAAAGAHDARVRDQLLGKTCHMCRQKTLCNEKDCARCSKRDTQAECTGKTDCSSCHGGTGIFCAPCLLDRYGEEVAVVRADRSWLCPHCREEKDGGWKAHGRFCNSSTCMPPKGFYPTAQAANLARRLGYCSVADLLQATYLRHKERKKAAAGGTNAAGGLAAAAEALARGADAAERPAVVVAGAGAATSDAGQLDKQIGAVADVAATGGAGGAGGVAVAGPAVKGATAGRRAKAAGGTTEHEETGPEDLRPEMQQPGQQRRTGAARAARGKQAARERVESAPGEGRKPAKRRTMAAARAADAGDTVDSGGAAAAVGVAAVEVE